MDAPQRSVSSSSKWGTFLQEFAQNRETLPSAYASQRLNRIEKHITSIFRECHDHPQSQTNLNLILEKFSKSDFLTCNEISRKIAELSGKRTKPDQARKLHPIPSQSINDYVSKWNDIVGNPNRLAQAFFGTLLSYYKDLPPEEVNGALSDLFQKMHEYFNVRRFSPIQEIHASESLEFINNLLEIRDIENSDFNNLVELLVLHKNFENRRSASALLWKKINFKFPSIGLLNALARDIVGIGPLWTKDAEFKAKLEDTLERFMHERETATPQAVKAFAHLCSELNKISPDSLPISVRSFALEKRVVVFKDNQVCSIRNYKLSLFAKHSRYMERFSNVTIDPKVFAKALDYFYGYRSNQGLTFNELLQVLRLAQEVGNLDLRSQIHRQLKEITDLTDDQNLERHFFQEYEDLLTFAGRDKYDVNNNYPEDSLLGIYQKYHRNQIQQFELLKPKVNGAVYIRYANHLVAGPVLNSFADKMRTIQPDQSADSLDLGHFYSLLQTTRASHIIAEKTQEPKSYKQICLLIDSIFASSDLTNESKESRLNLIKKEFPETLIKQTTSTACSDVEDIAIVGNSKEENSHPLRLELRFNVKNVDPNNFKMLLGFNVGQLWFVEESKATRQIAQMFYMAEVKYDVQKPVFDDIWFDLKKSIWDTFSGKKQ